MPEQSDYQVPEDLSVRIKELEEENAKLKKLVRLSYLDQLTEVFNRRGLEKISDKIYSSIIRGSHNGKQASLSVIFIDLDDFKKVNDTYGHEAGDVVLKKAASIFTKSIRSGDIVGRWGGEEFLIVLPNSDEEGAMTVAEKIREELKNEMIQHKGDKIKVTASLGVSSSLNQRKIKDIIDEADKAMYHAKKNLGKNTVAKYSDIN